MEQKNKKRADLQRTVYLFLGFCIIVIQIFLWNLIDFNDETLWVGRIDSLVTDLSHPTTFSQESYSEHPGSPILLVGAASTVLGFSNFTSLHIAVVTLLTVLILGAGYLAKTLFPNYPWWIGVISMLTIHPLYFDATPVDTIFAPLLVFFVLLLINMIQSKDWQRPFMWIFAGFIAGMMVATRLHFALLFIGMVLLGLGNQLGWRNAMYVGASSILWWVLLTPLLWFIPFEYLYATLEQVGFFTGSGSNVRYQELYWRYILFFAPFTVTSVILALVIGIKRPTLLPLPKSVGIPILVVSIIMTAILMISHLHSVRYFYPLIYLWDVFLPLLLLTLIQQVHIKTSLSPRIAQTILQWAVISLVISSQVVLFVHNYIVNTV